MIDSWILDTAILLLCINYTISVRCQCSCLRYFVFTFLQWEEIVSHLYLWQWFWIFPKILHTISVVQPGCEAGWWDLCFCFMNWYKSSMLHLNCLRVPLEISHALKIQCVNLLYLSDIYMTYQLNSTLTELQTDFRVLPDWQFVSSQLSLMETFSYLPWPVTTNLYLLPPVLSWNYKQIFPILIRIF